MSKISLKGNASGSGTLSIEAPNTNSDRVLTLPDAAGTVVLNSATQTLTNKTLTAPLVDSLNGGQLAGFRNKIIGGDFSINPWQRDTSFTAPTSVTYTADRWLWQQNESEGVVNILKTADAPTAAQAGVYATHCLHVDVTTADASATTVYAIQQRIEGYNAAAFGFGQSGTRYITLSFWVKSTKTGTYCIALRNNGNTRTYVTEYTVSSSDVWEKKTVTMPVDTEGTWTYDNGIGLFVIFVIAGNSVFNTPAVGTWQAGNYLTTANQVNALDSTANNFKIALVQLEEGTVATPFEQRLYGTELVLCQRYFTKSYNQGTAVGASLTTGELRYVVASVAGEANPPVILPVVMRASPTVTFYSANNGASGYVYNYTSSSNVAMSGTNTIGERGWSGGGTGFTASSIIGYQYTAAAEL